MSQHILNKMLNPIRRRLSLMVTRGLVTLVNDNLKRQNLQLVLLADESSDDIERMQNYGHTSVPPTGSEAIVVAVNGARSGLTAIAVEDKEVRPTGLIEGDSMLYHRDGHNINLTKDGKALVTATEVILTASNSFTIISPETLIKGPLHVTGGISTDLGIFATGGITSSGLLSASNLVAGGISYLGHYHKDAESRDTTEPKGTV